MQLAIDNILSAFEIAVESSFWRLVNWAFPGKTGKSIEEKIGVSWEESAFQSVYNGIDQRTSS